MELEEKHIRNLKVILNRNKLLELLPREGIVAEPGVDEGDFSSQILSTTNPKKLYLIDSWESDRYNETKMNFVIQRFHKEIESGKVQIIQGKSEEELKKFKDGYFDWVYIDTTHSYEQTVKELELSRLKVKEGGIIAGHDYCQGNFERAYKYGVVQAVHEFCIKHEWEIVYLTHETHMHLSFAIKKI